jgi:chromosome partitioning protein
LFEKAKEGFRMRTVAIINQKGGCGKTTTSINLAACLARLGHKTLLVDVDPQGHCGVGLAVPEDQIERTIYDAMLEERDGKVAKLNEIVWQIASDFDLAPSNIKLAGFEQVFAGRAGREDRLAQALEQVRGTYEWCIIDCPPSVGLLTFNALRACDEVIVPVETGFFSLHGLAKMMETLEVLKERCGNQITIRVLPTLYDTRTKLAREVLSELRAKFRDYLMESTVNFNTKLKEAASFGQPITEYDPGSRGYKDFVNLARELMGHRPTDVEPLPTQTLSRPAELVQRAKQLAQLTNFQFGRNSTPVPGQLAPSFASPSQPEAEAPVFSRSSAAVATAPAPAPAPAPVSAAAPIVHNNRISALATINPQPATAKTTEQKIDEFYGVKQIGEEVIFSVRFENARRVQIAGDFNNWSPMSTPMMTNGQPGVFKMSLPLKPGRYRYRFVVDGNWVTDPNNQYVEANQFGELNNVVEVD